MVPLRLVSLRAILILAAAMAASAALPTNMGALLASDVAQESQGVASTTKALERTMLAAPTTFDDSVMSSVVTPAKVPTFDVLAAVGVRAGSESESESELGSQRPLSSGSESESESESSGATNSILRGLIRDGNAAAGLSGSGVGEFGGKIQPADYCRYYVWHAALLCIALQCRLRKVCLMVWQGFRSTAHSVAGSQESFLPWCAVSASRAWCQCPPAPASQCLAQG